MTEVTIQKSLESVYVLIQAGQIAEAVAELAALQTQYHNDAIALQAIADAHLQCGQHIAAAQCQARSAELEPRNPDILFNHATSLMSHGQLAEAEQLLKQVINLRPDDYGARLNLSGLKRQSKDSNHLNQLLFLRKQLDAADEGHVPLCYALAKELEDIGKHEASWKFLQEGSQRRRNRMNYDVGQEEKALAEIAQRFNQQMLTQPAAGHESNRPIFILGMPRSGSTLLDRMLSSHSQIGSLGEHNTLVLGLLRAAGGQQDKSRLLERSVAIDFAALGKAYVQSIEGFGNPSNRLIDKTPQNFLYMGLIERALPGARIIHMRRHPLDSCYAVYKTLFRAGYPFSYRLQELGRYYIAYSRLMDHWRTTIPEAFIEVDYEKLVVQPEAEVRRVLDYLELDFEESCLSFDTAAGVAATASAAQVRQPVHTRSVGLWRKYEQQLTPFANRLREQGIEI